MNRTGWITVAVTAAFALMIGFGAGWVSYQTYLRASLESAFEETGLDLGDDADVEEAAEPADEPAEQPEDETASQAEPASWPNAVAMGESASDGTWDITLTNVERTSQISGSYDNATAAQGREFVVLEAELTNDSTGPQAPDAEDSEVVDTEGSLYACDLDALWALNDDSMYTDVNPGGSVTISVPFDVAEGTELEVALLTGVWDGQGAAELLIEEG
ncbi:DUF4352 domain-containing protein [Nocardiopsis oceani]